MFGQIPIRIWLLIAIASIAFTPIRYVYRHFANSPARRDITLPREDLSWRTSGQLVRNIIILAALGALAVFIFMPAAEEFARSAFFIPILLLGLAAFAFYTVVIGFLRGRIQPLVKGVSSYFERETQPKRFWASLCWNTIFGGLCVWVAIAAMGQANEDRCYEGRTNYAPQDKLSACNKLLGKSGNTKAERARLLAARGIAYDRLGDYEKALADYDQAIALDPKDSYSLYNRGLVYEELDDAGSAILAYSESLELRPDNADAYLRRGWILLDRGRFDEALADFTHANDIRPNDRWALADRGLTYAWKQNRALAERDFEAVKRRDPSNPVLLRGEALLNMNAGEFQTAIDRLTEELHNYPDDMWSLGMRAQAYHQLGEDEKARDDLVKAHQLYSQAEKRHVSDN